MLSHITVDFEKPPLFGTSDGPYLWYI